MQRSTILRSRKIELAKVKKKERTCNFVLFVKAKYIATFSVLLMSVCCEDCKAMARSHVLYPDAKQNQYQRIRRIVASPTEVLPLRRRYTVNARDWLTFVLAVRVNSIPAQ